MVGNTVPKYHFKASPHVADLVSILILDKIKRSYSSSNVVSGCFNVDDESLSQSLQDIPRIKVKLTYISKQEKINISIMEAENFFIGRTVYLKVISTRIKTGLMVLLMCFVVKVITFCCFDGYKQMLWRAFINRGESGLIFLPVLC